MLKALICSFLLLLVSPVFATNFIYIAEDGPYEARDHRLFNYDSETSISTLRTAIPGHHRLFSMVYVPSTKTVVAVEPSQDSKLYKLDINSGATTVLSNTGLVDIGSLALNPLNEKLYGIGVNTRELYSIDPWTGGATFIGTTQFVQGTMAFAPNGNLYGIDRGFLYKIDPTNAHETRIGGLNDLSGGAEDAKITPDGVMYMVRYDGGIYSVDLATGAHVRVDDYRYLKDPIYGNTLGLLDNPPVPEPSAFSLLAIASFGFLGRRRSRR
jgi:hypothetical protein